VRLGGNLHAFAGGLRLWHPDSGVMNSPAAAVRRARR
jgi:hypothetical protein